MLRVDTVVGLVFGTEGRFGLAVLLSEVENYLREYAVSWGSTAKAAPIPTRIFTGESVEALRKTDAVRALQPLEDEKNVTTLPNGVYGFAVPRIIDTDPTGVVGGTGANKISLIGAPAGTRVMEVHKLQSGAIYVVGYVSKNDLDRLQNTSTTSDVDVTIFFTPYKEYFSGITGLALP
jgi:hypothetical protein